MAEYVNIHGDPLGVSAKDAVLALVPKAKATKGRLFGRATWCIENGRRDDWGDAVVIANGETEESAWRAALSAMRLDDMKEVNHG